MHTEASNVREVTFHIWPLPRVVNLRTLSTAGCLLLVVMSIISVGCAQRATQEPLPPRLFQGIASTPIAIRPCRYIDGSARLDECVAAAEHGDVAAMRRLFDAYSGGSAVPKNIRRAE